MSVLLSFLALLLGGLPILFTLLAATLLFIYVEDVFVLAESLPTQFYGALEQNGLLAIPVFMLVGEVMNKGGLTERLIAAANVLVGRFKGGLAYVNLLTNAMAASILGSAIAQIAVMSRLMVPAMEKQGYDKSFAAAVTISGGLLGPIIPPSMLMIIYGVISFQPVATLFVAGILPGVLMVMGFAAVIIITGLFVELPAGTSATADDGAQAGVWSQLAPGLLPGLVPFAVIAGIVSGAMTPTEAGAVAALLSIIIGGVIYRDLKFADIPAILLEVSKSTAMITSLIAAATVLGWALSFQEVPDLLAGWIREFSDSPLMFLLLVNLLMIVLGIFLESIAVMVVLVPILLPAAVAMGVDPVHFGVVTALATLVGLVTPPVGPGLFVVMSQNQMKMGDLFKAMIPFLAMMLAVMAVINALPALSTWLPKALGM
ncbi:C4-dicarboxylate TRAP transporter large permease protein DctM [compost metagenome]